MYLLFPYIALIFITTGCQSSGSNSKVMMDTAAHFQDTAVHLKKQEVLIKKDTLILPVLKPYSELVYDKVELLRSAPGTKSVLFNSKGSKLYAMNLEGMSVYEFDQATRKILREFKFKPTKGTGWDYVKEKPIPSFQEKPVEACFSHDDTFLWVSLHNAEGIVPLRIDSMNINRETTTDQPVKKITVIYPGTNTTDSFNVPLIKTGRTPKVISRTADSKYLLVSNWHSHSVSVLELDKDHYPFGKVTHTIPVSSIPRGIAVDDKNKKSYVAIMGGASLAVLNNDTWEKDSSMNVASNPRHVVMDTSGHLFVSYNKLATIACIDAATGKSLFTAATHAQPRTIVLSKNHRFIFVTCYSSDYVDVYKINDNSFTKIASLPCSGHPVGVDVFENDATIEAWVCSYSSGSISIYSFKKKF